MLSPTACKTNQEYKLEAEQLRTTLPDEYRRTGMISSSTYQVYYRVMARDQADAESIAKNESEQYALKYLLQEPFIYVTISQYGVQRLQDLIKKKGQVVAVQKANDADYYEIVYHITDYGLREQFQYIR